jgi:hypothetical protein
MTKSDSPVGKRFSHVYEKRGELAPDSPRMRRRFSAMVYASHGLREFRNEIEKELGVPVGENGWHHFFAHCDLGDFLDAVTVGYRLMLRQAREDRYGFVRPDAWVATVRRMFSEEGIHYTVDDRGGVHFAFDREFEVNCSATIAALNGRRFANVLAEFQEVDSKLAEVPPNGKGAIRSTFAAAEGLFRLMFPAAPRLSASEIDKRLLPKVQRVYAADVVALRAATKLVTSLKEWVDAAHFYRHETGKEEVAQPPLTLAINLISLGASYIRWLAEIDSTATEA